MFGTIKKGHNPRLSKGCPKMKLSKSGITLTTLNEMTGGLLKAPAGSSACSKN